jgi:hypothetical protein
MATPLDQLDDGPQMMDADPEMANSILSQFNEMNVSPEAGYHGDLPPVNPEIPMMEHDMEQRNMNRDLENMRYMNPVAHIEAQKQAAALYQQQQQYDQDDGDEDEEVYEDDYMESPPLWKKILNESRIVVFVMIMVLFLFNSQFNKLLTTYVPYFRLNLYTYDTTTLGTVLKALLVGILSYLLIRFVRF